jgi:hypothetical protein
MNTFVTSFIDLSLLEEKRSQGTGFYLEKGTTLLRYPFNFVVFCDNPSYSLLYNSLGEKDNIKYVIIDFKDLPVCNLLSKNSKLPDHRNLIKDTYNYMALMLSKVYFIQEAIRLNYFNTTHYSWIDLGILKLNFNPTNIMHNLNKINSYQGNRIRIPGCYLKMDNDLLSTNNIDWTLCGSFLSGSKEFLLIFQSYINEMILELQEKNIIVWEINVWSCIVKSHPELFDWYYALHDDSMFSNF